MENEFVSGLINTLGVGGVAVAACWYLMQRMDRSERERAKEALTREQRLVKSLEGMETYMRTTLASTVDRNTTAMNENARALTDASRTFKELPCAYLRHTELKSVIEQAQQRLGERAR